MRSEASELRELRQKSDRKIVDLDIECLAQEITKLRSELNDLLVKVHQLQSHLVSFRRHPDSGPEMEDISMDDMKDQVKAEILREFSNGYHIESLREEVEKLFDARMVSCGAEYKSGIASDMSAAVPSGGHAHLSVSRSCGKSKSSKPCMHTVTTSVVTVNDAGQDAVRCDNRDDKQGEHALKHWHDILDHNCMYDFEESIWDTSALVGTRTLGIGGSLTVGVALALTIAGQALFIAVVQSSLVEDDILTNDLKHQLHHWRMQFGQHVRNLDPVTSTSLTDRVCGSDHGLATSFNQKDWVQDVNDFFGLGTGARVGRKSHGSFLNGPVLCLLVICLWLFWIAVELRATLGWILAFWNLPISKRTEVSLLSEDQLAIRSVCRQRFVYVLFLGILRTALAVFLCIVGVLFLVFTTDIDDLLLNALALTFILDIDELMYSALLPRIVRVVMRCLMPLHIPNPRKAFDGGDVVSWATLLVVLCICVILKCTILIRVEDQLLDLKETICGGTLNFVFAFNPNDGAVEWAHTVKYKKSIPNTYAARAVKELSQLDLDDLPKHTSLLSRPTSLIRVKAMNRLGPGATELATVSVCVNKIDHHASAMASFALSGEIFMLQQVLSSVVGFDVLNCSQVYEFCDKPDLFQVRAICPVTCGCGDAKSGLYLRLPSSGCPVSCESQWVESAKSFPCQDVPAQNATQHVAWSRYWYGQDKYQELHGSVRGGALSTVAMMVGCTVRNLAMAGGAIDLCNRGSGSGIISYCPITCGCLQQHAAGCPSACQQVQNSSQLTAMSRLVPPNSTCPAVPRPQGSLQPCTIQIVPGNAASAVGRIMADQACCQDVRGFIAAGLTGQPLPPSIWLNLCCDVRCRNQLPSDPALAGVVASFGYNLTFCI